MGEGQARGGRSAPGRDSVAGTFVLRDSKGWELRSGCKGGFQYSINQLYTDVPQRD